MFERDDHNQADSEGLDAQRLRRDLKVLFGTDLPAATRVDDAVTAAAQRHFVRHRRSRLLVRVATIGAAAASIALVIWFTYSSERHPATVPTAQRPSPIQREMTAGKHVDIRDAFMLAKRLEAAEPLKRQWDFNGDGKVDRADVDAIAMAAVKLDGGAVQ